MQFPVSITIDNEVELGLIRSAFAHKIKENKEQIEQLSSEVKILQIANASFEKKLAEIGIQEAPKSKKPKIAPIQDAAMPTTLSGMSVVMQVALALKNIGKPASTREIIDWLLTVDATLLDRNGKTYDVYQKAMAATLVQKVKAGKLFSSTKDLAGGYITYSLLEWYKPE